KIKTSTRKLPTMSATQLSDDTTPSHCNILLTEDNSDDDQYNNGHQKKKKKEDKLKNNEPDTTERKNLIIDKEKKQKSRQSSLPLINTTPISHDQSQQQQTISIHAPGIDSADEFPNLEIEQAEVQQ